MAQSPANKDLLIEGYLLSYPFKHDKHANYLHIYKRAHRILGFFFFSDLHSENKPRKKNIWYGRAVLGMTGKTETFNNKSIVS